MALNILSIPAMTADAERLFSSRKLILTDTWNHMKSSILEAIICLKSMEKEEMMERETIFGHPLLQDILACSHWQ